MCLGDYHRNCLSSAQYEGRLVVPRSKKALFTNMYDSKPLTVGLVAPQQFWQQEQTTRRNLLEQMAQLGVDHLYTADHVSFRNGSGMDGFVEVAALSQLHPSLKVMISIYLLPLRHPLVVARQLESMHKIAPGRLLFGVGVGGEDRHEIEVCGVDPKTRGRRMNESLHIIRRLMTGEPLDFSGEFFELEKAQVIPRIDPATPILIGGRSDAALRRTGVYGDGWIGVWCSPQRFEAALSIIDQSAADCGRVGVAWQHGYQPWVGVADTKAQAREIVAREMEAFYKVPFEKFERYTPFGTPADVAQALAPYVAAGCSIMNLKVCAGSAAETITGAGEIARLLRLPR